MTWSSLASILASPFFLKVLTQLGGIAWLLSLLAKSRRWMFFALIYTALSLIALVIAPLFGRVPLPCLQVSSLHMQNPMYCALNRHYVSPEMAVLLQEFANEMNATHP